MTSTENMTSGLENSNSIFVTTNGDIYIDNGFSHGRVEKWTMNAANYVVALYVPSTCHSLFVDINDNLYCSMGALHQVVKKSFNDSANSSTIVAGNGTNASAPNTLNMPRGIFVDSNLSLYVADCENARIQLFYAGQLNGITVAGNGSTGTLKLSCPIGVMLDADGYLFIADRGNNRIFGSGPNGYRCLVGCMGRGGAASDQLSNPRSFSFDSYGNIFVVDRLNFRIQQFFLATNSCGKIFFFFVRMI
jgi:hypothetical protein